MKALTVRQPWASLIALEKKRIETRTRRTSYRGPVLIHAGMSRTVAELATELTEPFLSELHPNYASGQSEVGVDLPRGQVIAVAELRACFPAEEIEPLIKYGGSTLGRQHDGMLVETYRVAPHEIEFGDYSGGRHGWVLDKVQRLANPVSAVGKLGLWTPPTDVLMPVLAQVQGYDMPGAE